MRLHRFARLPAEALLRGYRYLDKRDENAVSR
jgi:hypothetical protein